MNAIIFLHGLGDSPDASASFLEQLRTELEIDASRVLSPDLAGYDDSLGEEVTIESMAAAVADDLPPGITSPLVIGHSLGALVALALVDRLENVPALVYLEGAMVEPVADSVRPYAAQGRGHARMVEELKELKHSREPTDHERAYLASVRSHDPAFFEALAGEIAGRWAEFAEMAARTAIPQLYIAGAASVGESVGEPTGWTSATTDVSRRVAVIDRAGHNPQLDRPAAVIGTLLDFLSDIATKEPR